MSRTRTKWGVGLAAALALLVALGFSLSTTAAVEDPTEIRAYGSGEAVAAPWVTYDNLAGGTTNVGSDRTASGGKDATGNHFTFAFNAIKNKDGTVEGLLKWEDTDLGAVIEAEVVSIDPHPKRGAPTGYQGTSYRIVGKTSKPVTIEGTTFSAGSLVNNSPAFDGGSLNQSASTVCFEIFDGETAEDTKIYQWSAFVTGGIVRIDVTR